MKASALVRPKNTESVFSWRSLLLFDLFLLASLILATRTATFLHETLGHAFMAIALGGQVNAIQISPFGGGHVYYHLGGGSGLFLRFLAAFGGILINGLSGIGSILFVQRLSKRPGWAVFLNLLGMVSLLGAIAYSALGFYYDQGDPVAWIEGSSSDSEWFWIPFIILSPFVSYFAVRSYCILNEAWFPTKTCLGRIGMIILTLGITGCAYASLYQLTKQRSTAMDAPLIAYQRAEKEVRRVKKQLLYRTLRESHPEWTDEEIRRSVEKTPIMVKPEEVPKKFLLKPVIAFLYITGGIVAVLFKRGPGETFMRISPRSAIWVAVLAGAVLGVLGWTEGWIWCMNGALQLTWLKVFS